MNITVRRTNGQTFELTNGVHRLKAQLEVFGKASVTDAETGETFDVHEVDGQIVALDDGRSAIAETVAAAAIERAAQR
jgi:hypothetical protein